MTDLRRIVGRRAMRAWVQREAVSLTLIRREKSDDGAGGEALGPPTPLPPQRFRIAATARQHDMEATTTAGEVQGADWFLVSESPAADVKEGDVFEHSDRWWRVKFVDQRKEWRVGAGVVEHGVPGG